MPITCCLLVSGLLVLSILSGKGKKRKEKKKKKRKKGDGPISRFLRLSSVFNQDLEKTVLNETAYYYQTNFRAGLGWNGMGWDGFSEIIPGVGYACGRRSFYISFFSFFFFLPFDFFCGRSVFIFVFFHLRTRRKREKN